jgi:FlaA1/EpsC-like NDP-sugar epimerase
MIPRLLSARRLNGEIILHKMIGYFLDGTAFGLSGFLALELRFDFAVPAVYLPQMQLALCIWIAAKVTAFIAAKLDHGGWRYTSINDVVRIILANSAGSLLGGLAILLFLGAWAIPHSVLIIDWMLSCMFTIGARLLVRVLVIGLRPQRSQGGERRRTLIYGVGAAGLALLGELQQNTSLKYDVVGLIDDDPSKAQLILSGRRVLGTGGDLGKLAKKYSIDILLIAIPSATGAQIVRILKLALDAGVQYKMVPGLGDLIENAGLGKQLKEVAVEDLLGRRPVSLDQDGIRKRIQGKVVMVTGAAGSIGSEICRQIARFDPLTLVGFDAAETPLFQIDRELQRTFPDLTFHAEIGSITNPGTLRRVMERYRPSVLYHAAAYKHVPMMEKHVFAAVENNIFGTWNVAQAAIQHGVRDFVMISTDKAVRPTSMMGASKRVAELVIRALQKESDTQFVAVRFGNVLGSNGSVVPIFKEQIAAGGPVTVTHPEMSRYFMTIPEASQLVLQAFSIGKGGEVFVLDMGKPVKIVDLARSLILLSGLQPERDIEIEFTGLRPGEKLFEELNLQSEHLVATSHPQIKSYVSSSVLTQKDIRAYLQELQQISEERDVGRLLLLLKELIIDYNPDSSLLRAALSDQSIHVESVQHPRFGVQSQSALPSGFVPAAQAD